MFRERQLTEPQSKLTRRQVLRSSLAAGAMAALPGPVLQNPKELGGRGRRLFPAHLPLGDWVEFEAEGFSTPVIGVIHGREYRALCGMPLGGIGTGCLDLETSGLFGLCSIFNSHTPRRGALNWPFLGIHVNGQTWVLTTGQQSPERGSSPAANEPRPADLMLPGATMVKN